MLSDYIKRKRILLVDDEPELLDMVASILREDGYENIRTAGTVEEALKEAEKSTPEFAILDVMLPDGDGFDLMEKLKETQAQIEAQKEDLEQEKTEQEEMLDEVETQKSAVNSAIDAKTQEIASYQSQIQTASGEQSEYEKQLAEQEKLLEQIENQIAAAAAAAASADDGDGGASGFLWPCPASHRITSSFGPRTAPVAGASTYHKGIDIGASSGSAIVASAGGRVTTATYSSSAGNYVVVSHGNGISTVYMHASALYVSVGDVVSQGDTIAAVGSTGYSTGPHLHFGVIVNGSYVNPLNYVQ